LAIAPFQDVLNLGSEARMNVPGRAEGNWGWRCGKAMLSGPAFDRLQDLTEKFKRRPDWSVSEHAAEWTNSRKAVAV
jgi:4-alpha-glucanotransferase